MTLSLVPGIPQVLAGNLTFLVIATGFIHLLKNRLSSTNYIELVQRVRSWWIIFGICSFVFLANKAVFLVFLSLVSFIALKEFISVVPTRKADRKIFLLAYLSIPLQYLWVAWEWYGLFIIFIPIIMFLLLQICMLVNARPEGYLRAFATLYFGIMTTVFSLSHLGYLMILPLSQSVHVSSACLVLYLIILTQLNDVSQYVWGKCLGNKQVIPFISPNKTQAGMMGGIVTTALLSLLLAPMLTPFGHLLALCTGALISITGSLGDLSISAIKRDLGLKNTSDLLPGHGGILDRVDSLTFTAPIFFHCYYSYLVNSGQLT